MLTQLCDIAWYERFIHSFGACTCFPQTTCYVEEEFHVYGKREDAYFRAEAATGNREKWQESYGHVITFAVRISRKSDAKSIFQIVALKKRQLAFLGS